MARNINSFTHRKPKAQPMSQMLKNTLFVIYGPNWAR